MNAKVTSDNLYIAQCQGNYIFCAEDDVSAQQMAIPIPLAFECQTPISLNVHLEPESLVSKIEIRKKQSNFMLLVEFNNMNTGDEVIFEWKCPVLIWNCKSSSECRENSKVDNAEDEDIKKLYLSATKSVQIDHPDIQSKAAEIRRGCNKATDIIKGVIEFQQKLRREFMQMHKKTGKSLDAVTALKNIGSCTGAANLVAALLRANQIPARILATHPTWFPGHQMHYIVECFIDSEGWVWLESTIGRFPEEFKEQIVVSIVHPQNENLAFKPSRFYIPGVPWLSVPEHLTPSDSFYYKASKPSQGLHKAEILQTIPGNYAEQKQAFVTTANLWKKRLTCDRAVCLNEADIHKEFNDVSDYLDYVRNKESSVLNANYSQS